MSKVEELNRIPTSTALAMRKVNIAISSCHSCNDGMDESNNILVNCPIARGALGWILNWCQISDQQFNSVAELVGFVAQWGRCPKKRTIFIAIIYGFLWCGWKARNAKVFDKVRTSSLNLTDNIITLVFNWVKYRGKFGDCN